MNSASTIRRNLLSIAGKRDLDADGTGFLSPNESSITAACYPVRPLSPLSLAALLPLFSPISLAFRRKVRQQR